MFVYHTYTEFGEHLWRHHGLRHGGCGHLSIPGSQNMKQRLLILMGAYRSDDSRFDVVFSTFRGQCLREGHKPHLSRTVVCLTKIA